MPKKSWAMGELQGQNYNRNGSFSELYVGMPKWARNIYEVSFASLSPTYDFTKFFSLSESFAKNHWSIQSYIFHFIALNTRK
jgi:hypothetical protein